MGAQLRCIGVLVAGLICGCDDTAQDLPDGTWYWGDLHAHSGWSWDGCEDAENDCRLLNPTPAATFFDVAEEQALDFAALTDHAEADIFYPDGFDGDALAIWEGQQAVVEQASGNTLPILGYEWTSFSSEWADDRMKGSHRTVLLADPAACEDYRVPAWPLPGGIKEHEGAEAVFEQTRENIAPLPVDLWAALRIAEESCAPVRWITFAHHPAYIVPQVTDWFLEENNPEHETLVEIYSEHGSSECQRQDWEGCDWRINEAQGYYPDGAVYAALTRGYALGFVAGTDGHDARPGSLEDGPSNLAHWYDSDGDGLSETIYSHFTAGGLTGVMLDPDTDLTTDSLFDALEARTTVASSGPQPHLRVAAYGANGERYLPGELLPRRALPVTIQIEVEDDEATELVIERIAESGILSTTTGTTMTDSWVSEEGDWTYLRLRYLGEDDEERVWVSPWFINPSGVCGCNSQPGNNLPILCLLLLIHRRRWNS